MVEKINVSNCFMTLKYHCEKRDVCRDNTTGDECKMYKFCSRYDIRPYTWDKGDITDIILEVDTVSQFMVK